MDSECERKAVGMGAGRAVSCRLLHERSVPKTSPLFLAACWSASLFDRASSAINLLNAIDRHALPWPGFLVCSAGAAPLRLPCRPRPTQHARAEKENTPAHLLTVTQCLLVRLHFGLGAPAAQLQIFSHQRSAPSRHAIDARLCIGDPKHLSITDSSRQSPSSLGVTLCLFAMVQVQDGGWG